MNSPREADPSAPSPPPLPHQSRRIRLAFRIGLILGIVQAAECAIIMLSAFVAPGPFPAPLILLLLAALAQAVSAYQLSRERFSAFLPFTISSFLVAVLWLFSPEGLLFSLGNLFPIVLLYLSRAKSSPAPKSPVPSSQDQVPQAKNDDPY